MYRCQKCNQLSQPGEPAAIVVVATRERVYPEREFAMRRGRGVRLRWIKDPGGVGTEIVQQEIQHERCADESQQGT